MSFYDVLTEAINDVSEHGYDSAARIERWITKIRAAAKASMIPEKVMQRKLKETLNTIYTRMISKGGIWKYQEGASHFLPSNLKPKLRAELQRRIEASADLIRLNREQAIAKTLQRFQGWSTSIPKGGTGAADKKGTKSEIRKALAQLPFEERRVLIDQGHKFVSSLSAIIADDQGAIAAKWDSNWRQPDYDYREDHKERDYDYNKSKGKEYVYLIRGSWAHKQGLVKPGDAGYTDDITAPGEEVFCRCAYQYVYALSDLPVDMLTAKGRIALAKAQAAMADQ